MVSILNFDNNFILVKFTDVTVSCFRSILLLLVWARIHSRGINPPEISRRCL